MMVWERKLPETIVIIGIYVRFLECTNGRICTSATFVGELNKISDLCLLHAPRQVLPSAEICVKRWSNVVHLYPSILYISAQSCKIKCESNWKCSASGVKHIKRIVWTHQSVFFMIHRIPPYASGLGLSLVGPKMGPQNQSYEIEKFSMNNTWLLIIFTCDFRKQSSFLKVIFFLLRSQQKKKASMQHGSWLTFILIHQQKPILLMVQKSG